MELVPGMRATCTALVGDGDTAIALRSGDVPVLGTPRVVALLEEAAVKAVSDALEPALTTVGTRIAVDHVAPTAVGRTVEAVATLTAVDGRTLDFDVVLWQGQDRVAGGSHRRVVVDRETFLGRL